MYSADEVDDFQNTGKRPGLESVGWLERDPARTANALRRPRTRLTVLAAVLALGGVCTFTAVTIDVGLRPVYLALIVVSVLAGSGMLAVALLRRPPRLLVGAVIGALAVRVVVGLINAVDAHAGPALITVSAFLPALVAAYATVHMVHILADPDA